MDTNDFNRRRDDGMLHQLDNRLAVVESELEQLTESRRAANRWLMAVVLMLIANGASAIYGFSRLDTTVSQLNIPAIQSNIATALSVLSTHREEINLVDAELARLRGAHDTYQAQIENLRRLVDTKTADRFYRADGDRLVAELDRQSKRISRVEDRVFEERQERQNAP